MISFRDITYLRTPGAVRRMLAGRFENDPDKMVTAFDRGLNYLLRTDLKKAGLYLERAVGCYKFLPGRYFPRLLSLEARFNLWKGDYKQAEKKYLKARHLFAAYHDFANVARVGRGLMDVYMYLGRYREALATGRKSLNYFRKIKSGSDVAQLWTNIGNVYHRMDNNRLAIRCYDRAREIFKKDGGLPLAIVEYNRANVYANLNQLKKATGLYLAAAAIYRKAGLHIAESQATYSIGYLYFLEDRYTEALKTFEDVYTAFTRQGDIKSAAVTQLDLVEVNLQLNQYGSAVMMGKDVIGKFRQLAMRYEEGKAAYFVALAGIQLKDNEPALRYLRRAERLFRFERNNLWLGMVADARSRIYIALKKYGAAEKTSREAQRLFASGGDERRTFDAVLRQLEIRIQTGDRDYVRRLSPAFLKKKALGYQRYNLYSLLGRYHYERQEYGRALFYFKKAVTIVEKMIGGLYLDEIRFFFLMDKFDSYLMVVQCLLKKKRYSQSFLYHLQALSLVNQKTFSGKKLKADIPEELLAERERLRTALKRLSRAPRSEQRLAEGVSATVAAEQRLWANERRIRSVLCGVRETERKNPLAEQQFSRLLQRSEILVNFLVTHDEIGAFCASNGEVRYVRCDIAPEELRRLLRKLHFVFEKAVYGLRDAESIRTVTDHYLRELHEFLIKPLRILSMSREIIFLADGIFSQIPFSALQDEYGRCLKDSYKIKIVVNPNDLLKRKKTSNEFKKRRSAVFAVSSDSLPAIVREGEEIKQRFRKACLYLDRRAVCSNLTRELEKADGFIHIATHASRSSENPLFSRILMNDGPFFPFDLFETGIKARLVTLSGCQTAAPGLYYGNSFSLAKAFYQAGGQFVLATLWPVSDKLSMQFMIEFYRNLKKSDDVCASFDKAVDKLRSITDNPAFWGSFILLGI
ncbi:MAG: CHAT domain-containing protein [Candidatus Zixiibacteriota bacterium]